ncbi:MAG: hypothetical protein IOC39_03790 [Burkholderia sp.]|nr:hypothetical protein [Burkholderia sp.]MCA3784735.1 hypothetical protein [Burkholderia sp.]MCA3790797.1 hypothetical protein [Burkholderia sp.]MCA3804010.1 hypothetical protein [Burkholderia sp.]MCA3809758.1 hypothetical protein [Burkholderia sp.]
MIRVIPNSPPIRGFVMQTSNVSNRSTESAGWLARVSELLAEAWALHLENCEVIAEAHARLPR